MKNKKCWIALNANGRILMHTLSESKAGVVTDFIRRHRRDYTLKQLRDLGINIVRCDLHFLSNVDVSAPARKEGE
jgi:hypothetical protein